jgi:hypothetical protein
MINSWFKLRHIVCPQHPKVGKMARALGCNRMTAYGVACAWFRYVDMFTTDGQTHLTPDELDEELGFRGCANALSLVVWAALDDDGCVVAPNFDEHCGETAKKRAMNARYQDNYRKDNGSKKKILQSDENLSEKNLTDSAPCVRKKSYQRREEENREEKSRDVEELNGSITQQGVLPLDSPPPPSAPSGVQEVMQHMRSLPHAAITEQQLRSCAEKFCLTGQASGWTYKNAPLRDWRASAALYLSRWQENARKATYSRSNTSLQGNIYDS